MPWSRLKPRSHWLRLTSAPVLIVTLCGQDTPDMPVAGEWLVETSPISFEFAKDVPSEFVKGFQRTGAELGTTEQSCLDHPMRFQTALIGRSGCNVDRYELENGTATIRLRCDGDSGVTSMAADGTYTPDSIDLTTVAQVRLDDEDPRQRVTMTVHFSGRRLGDCPDQ